LWSSGYNESVEIQYNLEYVMPLLTASTPQLTKFLRNLALDPGLFEAFTEDRDAVLEDLELSEADRECLLTVGILELQRQLNFNEPNMGGSRTRRTEANMGGSRIEAKEPNMGTGGSPS
jgi:hypothetical protein